MGCNEGSHAESLISLSHISLRLIDKVGGIMGILLGGMGYLLNVMQSSKC